MPHIPVHPSAEKRFRQSVKRQLRNHAIKTRVRTATKRALEAITGNDQAAAADALRNAMKVLDKAVTKGTIPRNTASRKIARLSKRLHASHGTAKAQA
ncbi:MAG TPA: 30S ribosomal protein S20 [Candidatus Binataceae bacterium]|nr:30S ribosomal protein S20 [Candidatus Binataceae bacterium]